MTDNFKFFRQPDGHQIFIPASILVELEKFAQHPINSRESGGLLIGVRRGGHIEITDFTKPYADDFKSRVSFSRISKMHNIALEKFWRMSKREKSWRGEWHTHPEDDPTPSPRDQKNWGCIFPMERKMFLIIIGRKSNWYGFMQKGVLTAIG